MANESAKITDIVDTLRELCDTMPLPVRVTDALKLAADEIVHLREQRDRLQERGSELTLERQAMQARDMTARMVKLAAEELHKEIRSLIERALVTERVTQKMADNFDQYDSPAEFLTEQECYVLEAIDYRQSLLLPPGDPSCKEPTCTRKHQPHAKDCGCAWDHVANDWTPCRFHTSPKESPIIGDQQ